MSDVAARVKSIIIDQLGVDEEQVTPEASLTDDLAADSLSLVELGTVLESEFGVKIPEDEAIKLTTVGDVIKYLSK